MTLRLTPGLRIVAATHNPGKAREIAALLEGRFDIVAAGDLGLAEPEETEATFVGNAVLKARAAADASGLVALADDSGLSVTALGGAPGVLSARWAGEPRDFARAMDEVRRRLEATGSPDRSAWFTSALAVAWPHGPVVAVEGRVDGVLSFPGRGDKGFGYDPIFVPEGRALSFGEMDAAEKDAVSHRARAFEKLRAALFSTLAAPVDASVPPLAVYIHWPYCSRICPYCDFNVVRDRGRQDEQAALVAAIAADLQAHAALTGPRRLVSIFLGGGTPSLMAPEQAGRLIALARALWPADAGLEVTLEANPTDAEAGRFAAFAAAGVNRLSLGVQALDDAALRFLGRNHDAAMAISALEVAAASFPRLSLDLIYALPGQTAAAWERTLEQACRLGAEHISAYQLGIEPGTAFHRALVRGRLARLDPDLAADLYQAAGEALDRLGYAAYEVSNHARAPAARSRHNLAYWRGEDYVGVGPGAHGRLTTAAGRTATEAQARVGDYVAAVERTGRGWASGEPLTAQAAAEERLLMGLRIDEGVPLDALRPLALSPRRAGLIEAGLLRIADGRLQATPRGRPVLDRLVAELLA